jgi:CDP-diacylglycerol--glycerol-3-phosphate 3-phosphatidyltransferase
MNIPMQLTFLRFILAAVAITTCLLPGVWAKACALISFVVAVVTDWLDGYLARRWQQTSPLGALLDPIADKVLTLGVFFAFVPQGLLPLWMAALIAVREGGITTVRLIKARQGVVLAAEREGKWKAALQMLAIILVLISQGAAEAAVDLPAAYAVLMEAAIWLAFLLTVYSGAVFLGRNRQVLSGR